MANRLAEATSPYLQQHSENPVDWYEWGEEAVAAARERDVPIFLSVGYAACHWCQRWTHAQPLASLNEIAGQPCFLGSYRFRGFVYHSRVSIRRTDKIEDRSVSPLRPRQEAFFVCPCKQALA
jgi:hypothetical protein